MTNHQPAVCARQCSTCVFRPGNPFPFTTIRDVLQTNREQGTALMCHKTTYGQAEREAVCRGFYDAYGESINIIRVINRLGGFEEVDPDG